MNAFNFLAIAAVAGLCFTATPFKSQAQVSITIGGAPDCPYGYSMTTLLITARPPATMARNGLTAAYSSALASGITARPTSMAT
jgi:hypothetical protein